MSTENDLSLLNNTRLLRQKDASQRRRILAMTMTSAPLNHKGPQKTMANYAL